MIIIFVKQTRAVMYDRNIERYTYPVFSSAEISVCPEDVSANVCISVPFTVARCSFTVLLTVSDDQYIYRDLLSSSIAGFAGIERVKSKSESFSMVSFFFFFFL